MASGDPLPVFQVRELLALVNLLGVIRGTRLARLDKFESGPPFKFDNSETTHAISRLPKLVLKWHFASVMLFNLMTNEL